MCILPAATPVYASEAPTTTITTLFDEDSLKTLISPIASKFGVKEAAMLETIKCEARRKEGKYDALGKSQWPNEDSWGLAQIHLPSHPSVTKEQAQDPIFAVTFMAEAFAKGDAHLWTCWRDLKKHGRI